MSDFQGRPYFPCLTGLRAIAAFTVLFTHVERYRQLAGESLLMPYAASSFLGGLAVSFFFVLSGFLITSLLLTEKAGSGTIRVKKFLYRRMLRIWPLYYFVLTGGYLLSIFVLKDTPADPLKNGLVLNALLLPNIAFAFGLIPDILIQIWSIGTEEQFYLIWPLLVRQSSAKKFTRILIGIIAGAFLLRLLVHRTLPGQEWLNIVLYRTRIDCMALGGLFALLLFYKSGHAWLAKIYAVVMHPFTGGIAGVGLLVTLYLSWLYDAGFYQVYMFLSGVLIVRVTGKPVRFLEWGPLKYLGKISYGIYLLHNFLIFFLCRGFPVFAGNFDRSPWGDLAVFILAALLSAIAAALSYEFLESRFLRLRNRYSNDSILS